MNATEQYVNVLTQLKDGDLALLRMHIGQGLDETVHGFDLFAGLWWPLRARSSRAPRREVAWLIAKLYAFRQVAHSSGDKLARQLRRCRPNTDPGKAGFEKRFDRMVTLPIGLVEPSLQWAIDQLDATGKKLDWVKLTDDLSIWEREATRLAWAKQFLGIAE
jgi:CRISPR type I-E-associated protein CasB/Cse2